MDRGSSQDRGQPVQLEDIPIPQPGDDDILVRVHAASLNPVDLSVASGRYQHMLTTPVTLGRDFAGEVVSVGSHAQQVQATDAVYGMIPFPEGTFADYVLAKASEVASKPARLDFAHAAAVPLTALTAWQALFDVADVQPGERVLILGAAGGVGSFAAQFAKKKGAVVIGTASAKDEAFLRQDLGVDQVIAPCTGYFSHPCR
jgi:NADPH:quinone reductase-like Zn-dependent oxidoreductase